MPRTAKQAIHRTTRILRDKTKTVGSLSAHLAAFEVDKSDKEEAPAQWEER